MQDQLPQSVIIVLVHTQFGSVRVLEVHLMKNDYELYSRRDCVEVAWDKDIIQEIA